MYTQRNYINPTNTMFSAAGYVLGCLAMATILINGAGASDLSFAWSPVTYSGGPLVYEVHYGEGSGAYDDNVAATQATATVGDLQGDHTYYFAVRACTDDRELCSGFSNELSTTIPGAPLVNFTADKVSGPAPLKVNFSASTSGSIDRLNWWFRPLTHPGEADFGGPENANISFTYTEPGTYDVKLVAWGPGGRLEEYKTSYITVTAATGNQNDGSGGQGVDAGSDSDDEIQNGKVRNDLLMSFSDKPGLWMLKNDASWMRLNSYSVDTLVTADLDGDGIDEAIMDFVKWPGVFIWQQGLGFRKLHDLSAELITTGDLDNNDQEDLVIDFGEAGGAWAYLNGSTWVKLSIRSPSVMLLADTNGDGNDELFAVFYGQLPKTWRRTLSEGWTHIHGSTALNLVKSDIDGDGREDLTMSFGKKLGTWMYRNGSFWQQLNRYPIDSIVAADLDGDGDDEQVMNFEQWPGVFIKEHGVSGWSKLHEAEATSLTVADLDANMQEDLVIDFGSKYGLWSFKNNSEWGQINSLSVGPIASGDLDGN